MGRVDSIFMSVLTCSDMGAGKMKLVVFAYSNFFFIRIFFNY
jgi:hypothetical protein